ncbi:MAG TPA: gamma-glutamyl-gamma-aminobutyrate hydrolase family protein [Ktedonobacteraceae bacterium]
MYCVQPSLLKDDPDTIIAALLAAQPQVDTLPPRYRPLIGILVAPCTLDNGRPYLVGADIACIEAVVASGGEARLIPVRPPFPDEHAFELLLDAILQCDGLLFSGSASQLEPRLDSQADHLQIASPFSLLEWWRMLMTLIARETLTPLLGIGTGAASINAALGGTLRQERAGYPCCETSPDQREVRRILELDPDKLALCARGCNCSWPNVELPAENQWIEPSCMHDHSLDTVAPGLIAWSWADGQVQGFGYPGPSAWCVLATLFHLEAQPLDNLGRSLFGGYLQACRAYAASLREVLRTTRMRDKFLRKLYADPLAQPFLSGPLISQAASMESENGNEGNEKNCCLQHLANHFQHVRWGSTA